MEQGDHLQVKTFYDVIGSGLLLSFNIFRQPSTWHTRKTNCIKLQTTDPDKGPIFIFQESFWKQFLHDILQMIFQEKCFSCHVLLTDQISLLDCLYFLRYWVIMCIVVVCLPSCGVRNFETNLIFLIKPFFYMTKSSKHKI